MAKKVLVADHAAFVRHLLIGKTLLDMGYEVIECNTAEEALKQCGEVSPDLVILEIIALDGRDGLAIADEIRKQYPEVKVLLTGSFPYELYSMEAHRVGAVDFLTKPFQPNRLLQAVRDAIGGSGAAGEAEAAAKIEEASSSHLPDKISFKPFG